MQMVDELKTAVAGEGNKNAGGEAGKVAFLPEQQARVQELIDETYRKAFAKAQKKPSSDEVERLKSEVVSLREDKKSAEVYKAISRFNVVNADDVAKLIGGSVRLGEDGAVTVINESGSVRISASGHPVGIEEYIAGWLNERPHFLRGAGSSGAGSFGSRFEAGYRPSQNTSDPSFWRTVPREDLDRLLAGGITVQGSAGQLYKFRDVKNPFIEARRRKAQAVKR